MLFGPIVNLYEDFMPKVFETKTLLNKKRQKQAVVGL